MVEKCLLPVISRLFTRIQGGLTGPDAESDPEAYPGPELKSGWGVAEKQRALPEQRSKSRYINTRECCFI